MYFIGRVRFAAAFFIDTEEKMRTSRVRDLKKRGEAAIVQIVDRTAKQIQAAISRMAVQMFRNPEIHENGFRTYLNVFPKHVEDKIIGWLYERGQYVASQEESTTIRGNERKAPGDSKLWLNPQMKALEKIWPKEKFASNLPPSHLIWLITTSVRRSPLGKSRQLSGKEAMKNFKKFIVIII